MEAAAFLGSGDLFANIYENGAYLGMAGPFPCEKFEIKADSELKEKTSKGRFDYGQLKASAAIPKPHELNVTIGTLNDAGFRLALMATSGALAQASGNLTAVDVVLNKEYWALLGKGAIAATVQLKNAAGAVTYVEGTDYLVERTTGMVRRIEGGAIADGDTCKFTAAYAAISGVEFKGATQTTIRAKFMLAGRNLVDGSDVIVNVPAAVIASKAAVDFLSDNFGSVPLNCRMEVPAGWTSPYTIQRRNLA